MLGDAWRCPSKSNFRAAGSFKTCGLRPRCTYAPTLSAAHARRRRNRRRTRGAAAAAAGHVAVINTTMPSSSSWAPSPPQLAEKFERSVASAINCARKTHGFMLQSAAPGHGQDMRPQIASELGDGAVEGTGTGTGTEAGMQDVSGKRNPL